MHNNYYVETTRHYTKVIQLNSNKLSNFYSNCGYYNIIKILFDNNNYLNDQQKKKIYNH